MPGVRGAYDQVIAEVFRQRFSKGQAELSFEREELRRVADRLGVSVPKNLGDIVYTYRYRRDMPEPIRVTAPAGYEWMIEPRGSGAYAFALRPEFKIAPNPMLLQIKILDATPGIIVRYALGDEQAMLARVRYNRLIDVFTGATCYSLQSHLRSQVRGVGQIEVDEVYVGVNTHGAHFVFPVQAKGISDRIGSIQIEQDMAFCASRFPRLTCRPIAAQVMSENLIALFELARGPATLRLRILSERHYILVSPDALSSEELEVYMTQT